MLFIESYQWKYIEINSATLSLMLFIENIVSAKALNITMINGNIYKIPSQQLR